MKMPSKTELALSTSEELKQAKEKLIEEIQTLSDEKEKLKRKVASGGDISIDLVKAIQKLANQGNGGNGQPIDTTPQGYAVLPPVPINSMLPIQKVKWRIDNVTAILEKGGLKPAHDTELRRKIYVWQKKLVELYEAMKKETPELLTEDTKLIKNPDATGKMVSFHLKEYYDENVAEIARKIKARQDADAKLYPIPVHKHVYK